jgi:Leucine-rich repeat (LRR) protein
VQSLVSKWEVTGNLRSYALDLDTTGKLAFISSSGGTSGTSANTPSSVATGFTDGTGHWVRATWRNSDNRVQFFTSNDASSTTSPTWTQLGTDQSWSSTAIFDSTAKLEVGSRNTGTGQPFAGLVYRAQVRNNVLDDGTGIQFDADFTSVTVTPSARRPPSPRVRPTRRR